MFDADPMDNLLLDAQDTTVVQQATAANDTFPAPYGDQQDEEALFAGLSGRPAKRAKVRAQGVRQVVRKPKVIGGGFLPGMGEDLDAMEVDGLGAFFRSSRSSGGGWSGLRKTLFGAAKPAPQPAPPAPKWYSPFTPPPKPTFMQSLEARGKSTLDRLATRESNIDAALKRRTERGTALQVEEDRLRALQAAGMTDPRLARRLQNIDTWQARDALRRQELDARKARIDQKQSMWGGLFSPVVPTLPAAPTVAAPTVAATTTSAPVISATSPTAPVVLTTPATTETVVPVASAVDAVSPPVVAEQVAAPRVSLAPGSAPGSQFYGLDGYGGFLPGLGEECPECADGDDVGGLGAAPRRLKPRVSRVQGSSRTPVRVPAKRAVGRRPVGGGFLPGMGDLGFAPTASPAMMIALGVVAAYFLLRK